MKRGRNVFAAKRDQRHIGKAKSIGSEFTDSRLGTVIEPRPQDFQLFQPLFEKAQGLALGAINSFHCANCVSVAGNSFLDLGDTKA